MKRTCYSFEPSNHKFRPLDGFSGLVARLYCKSCGRITIANTENNVFGWAVELLPAESQVDFTMNRRTDA